jgi:hypothetical protein
MRLSTIGKVAPVLLCAALALAQIGTSTITGRVVDSSGAVVPAVQVTVTNTDTNFEFTAQTNSEGLFRVQSLQPGPYRVEFQAAGFKRLVRENITLRTGDTLPVDAALDVGALAESVTVTALAPLLETETSATGTVQEGKVLYDLPIYQRFVASTLQLVPAIAPGGFAWGGDLSSSHVVGLRAGAIGMFEDGVVSKDQITGTSPIRTLQDSVAEVKILSTTLPAEYGHSAGGVVSSVKKTGTNELHFMASWYGRSRRMTDRNFFEKQRSTDPLPGAPNGVGNYYMQPDATVGGPVVLPKIYNGRNRTFFFYGWQKQVEKKTLQYPANGPNAAMLAGDFSFGGIGNPIYDPRTTQQLANGTWTRDPFPGNQIPLSSFDPVAKKIVGIYPWLQPNQPGTLSANGPLNNLLYGERKRMAWEDMNGRLDQQFGPDLKMYGSVTHNHSNGWPTNANIWDKDFSGIGNYSPSTTQNFSVGATRIINPTMFNDVRVGYWRGGSEKSVYSYNKNCGAALGIPNLSSVICPSFSANTGTANQFSPESIYGLNLTGPSRNITETISFRDDLSLIRGVHAFKMGYEVLRARNSYSTITTPSGVFNFDQMTAGLQSSGAVMPRTGNTFAGFLVGSVRQATFTTQLASWLPRSFNHGLYFQDDWKVSPTLTLNIGIRYTNESPYNTRYAQMSNFDPAAVDDVTGLKGGLVHPTSGLNKRDNNNFQPRIGVAWHPLTKWVFRGGFTVNTVDVMFQQANAQLDEYSSIVNQERAPGDPRPLYQISQGPNPVAFSIRSNGTSGYVGTNYGSRTASWWDPNLRNPYVLNWNTSIQYQIHPSYMLEASYQGSSGVGLIEAWEANTFPVDYAKNDPILQAKAFAAPQNYRPFPQFGNIAFHSNTGHSTFHSGNLKIEKRFSRGLVFTTFYTFSKAIDSQDSDTSGSGVAPLQNRSLEKARAGYDRAHRYVGEIVYTLPFGKGEHFLNRGGVWDKIFGRWQVSWIQTNESGNPLSFSFANSPYNYYPTWAGARRPNLVGQPQIRDGWSNLGGDRFNQANSYAVLDMNAFAYPAAFTPGNAGRNIITGLRTNAADASLQKNVTVGERLRLQIRADLHQLPLKAFGVWNFNPPTTTVDFQNPQTFGKLTGNPTTANQGGISLINITVALFW